MHLGLQLTDKNYELLWLTMTSAVVIGFLAVLLVAGSHALGWLRAISRARHARLVSGSRGRMD